MTDPLIAPAQELAANQTERRADQGVDPRRWYALGLLCVASFMVILDAQIVNVAVPSIERDLGFSAGGVQWVLTAYIVTFGGLLLFGGRTADLLGRRRMFMVGVAVFTVASLLCGLAWSGVILIVFRAVQGVAAAVMAPTALSIVLNSFAEGPERNKAIGIFGATAGVGGTAGALIGGPLTDGLGWEWIFFLNVPFGVLLLALSPVILNESRDRRGPRGFDVAGAVTITGALMLLIYGVSRAPITGLLGASTIVPLVAAVLLLAVFVVVEGRSAAPLVPLRIFRSRTLIGGNLVQLLAGMAAFGQAFILTMYAQQVLGWSAVQFGFATVVLPAMAVVGSMVGQRLVTRFGFRSVAAASMGLLAVGCLLWTGVSVDGTYAGDLFAGMLIFGAGLGAGTVAGSIAAVAGVAERESGLAAGLSNASFQIGGSLGVAILSTVAVAGTESSSSGAGGLAALTDGFQSALVAATAFGVLGLLVAVTLLRRH